MVECSIHLVPLVAYTRNVRALPIIVLVKTVPYRLWFVPNNNIWMWFVQLSKVQTKVDQRLTFPLPCMGMTEQSDMLKITPE